MIYFCELSHGMSGRKKGAGDIKADGMDDYQAGWRPGKGLIEQLRQISLSFLNLGLVSQVPTWGT